MAVKIAVLKSGEQIIADIKELVDENENVVSLVFENPYVVRLITPQILFESNSTSESEHKVSYFPWIPLSADKKIAVDKSWVVCIVEPHEMVYTSYMEKMGSVEKQEENIIENFEVIEETTNEQ